MKIKMNFHFCCHFGFHFRFCFRFCFLKVFAFLLTPRGRQVPLTVNSLLIGLESAIAFLLTRCGLEVPQTVNSLSCLAQKCHSIFGCEFSTWPSGAIDGQLSLDWPRSAIEPRNMAPSLIRICRIQSGCSLFSFLAGNTFFRQIWSKKSKLSVLRVT